MDPQRVGEQLQELVDGTLRRRRHVHNVALGVALGEAGFRWSGAAGIANPATGRPMLPGTPFLIASISKMYTAGAVMMLQERGRLALDDRISQHLPGNLTKGLHRHRGRDYTDSLTLRHLLGQTSGFPDYFLERPRRGRSAFDRLLTEGDRAWNLEDVVRYTREELQPRFAPATPGAGGSRVRAHYSDTNYKLLGAILEAVTGRPLHEVFEEMIFVPHQLDGTYLSGHPRSGTSGEKATVFYKDRPLALDRLMASHGPEGGIVSTLDDTLRFGRAVMTGELFASRETLDAMQRWNPIFFPLQYGYGLMRFKLPRLLSPFGFSPELIGHSGSSGSFLYHCPDLDLYLAGTINQMALPRVPFPLMIKVARLIERARR